MTLAERCDNFTKTRLFRYTVMGAILAGAAVAGLGTFVENDSYLHDVLWFVDWLFIIFFLGELLIRVIAHNWKLPAIGGDGWLLFDIVIVVGSVVVQTQLVDVVESLYVLRLARVFRASRLVSISPRLRLVIESFLQSIKSSLYVVILLAVITYGYAVLDVELFGSSHHFLHLGIAIISMVQVLTLDDWGNIFADVIRQEDTLNFVAITFFLSFIIFGTMIILNLFVAIVTDQMRMLSDLSDKE